MSNKVRETFSETIYDIGKIDKKICVIVSDISHFRLQKFAKENPYIINKTQLYIPGYT